jgi:hypothetical protein
MKRQASDNCHGSFPVSFLYLLYKNRLIIGCIDNYHNLHSIRIPSITSKDQISHMATILFNTSEASLIPYYTNDHLPIIQIG